MTPEDITSDPFEQMDEVYNEVMETLPDKQAEQEQAEPDYLDENQNNQQPNQQQSQPVMFNEDSRTDNLVIWQLRVDWDRVEHIVRGHKPKIDDKGNEYFVKIENHYLNEYGVNTVLHFLSFYLSKEIFLARYKKEEVDLRLKQFSKQFINFFYNNLKEFGMDDKIKIKMAPMFVQSVIDLVDASYSRAIEGKTADLVNKQFMVSQNQPLDVQAHQMQNPSQNRKGIVNRIFG